MKCNEKIKFLRERRNMTQQELAEAVGLKTASAINKIEMGLRELRQSTLITFAQALDVTPAELLDDTDILPVADKLFNIPIYESVSAGFGALANESVVDYTPLPFRSAAEASETLCIRVKGDSMSPTIEEGDIIQVKQQTSVDSGDIAVIGSDTKTEAGARLLPLTNAARDLFTDALREASGNAYGLIFAEKGKPISTSTVNLAFRRLCDKYGIIDEAIPGKVSLHSLRHTYATRCIEAGMSAKVLQELLGHTDIKITMNTYCDAFEQFKTRDIGKVEAYLSEQFG